MLKPDEWNKAGSGPSERDRRKRSNQSTSRPISCQFYFDNSLKILYFTLCPFAVCFDKLLSTLDGEIDCDHSKR